MQIYVGKNGQQLGPFSLEEVNRKLAEGTFAGTDLAWYEGAAGWAPLSGVAGVVIPTAAAAAPTAAPAAAPIPTPTPSYVQPAPAVVAPVTSNVPIVQPPRSNTKTLSVVTWALLGITFVVSFIPFVGCASWALGIPVALTAIILGIIMMTKGSTGSGIMAVLGGILIVPLCALAQFLSLMVFGGTVERKELTDIKSNLILIDSAKTKWVAETKATDGTPVTIANLKSQLGGKEVKPTMDETYDPMPVGQPPTATLPANKTLGTFSGGDILTVATVEAALANSSVFSLNLPKRSTPSPASSVASRPSPSPSPKLSEAPSPRASVAPSVTVSPKPSISPRTSATPHSLISPRRSEEPEQPPSTRPSPSAKFAPRVNPRQPPSEKPDSESGGLRQGRQRPRESPGESPEPSASPDDDD